MPMKLPLLFALSVSVLLFVVVDLTAAVTALTPSASDPDEAMDASIGDQPATHSFYDARAQEDRGLFYESMIEWFVQFFSPQVRTLKECHESAAAVADAFDAAKLMDVERFKNLEDSHDALSFVGSESFVKFYERVHDLLPKGADAAIILELNERLSARRTAIMLNIVSRMGEGQTRERATKLQDKLFSTWPLSNKAYDIVQHCLQLKTKTDLMTPGKPEYDIMEAFFKYKKTWLAGKHPHEKL